MDGVADDAMHRFYYSNMADLIGVDRMAALNP